MDEKENMLSEHLPIFQKGVEIMDVVHRICELIPEENDMLMEVKSMMMFDAAQLTIKVAGAEAAELYDLKMEAATIVRKSAMDLMVQKHALKMHGFEQAVYFDTVGELIEEYRILFIDWVKGFDQWDYVIDRWGLFNPPGVDPFDKDPDEDIPFDPSDLLS